MAKNNKYDLRHLNNLKKYGRQLDAIYREAIREAVAISGTIGGIDTDRIFSFNDYPETRKRVDKLFEDMQADIETVVLDGIDAEWTLANNKNSELANWVFGDAVGKLTQAQYRRYYSTNDSARRAFAARRVDGLNLSQRVWNLTDQFKNELELGLDVGIRNGRSADDLSRDIRQYLKRPDMLFRRVKDERGNLQLSKRAAAYHPGRGVYRSSYKNARRLAATETNIAYRTADHLRWQQMDFVVGIEIRTSPTNHPVTDICDDLKGKYPKDFKFTGWHPHCRCIALSILKTEEEMDADTERILNGEPPSDPNSSVNAVTDVPKEFKDWVEDNKERAERSFSVPYFLKDNQQYLPKDYLDLYGMKMPYDSYSAYEAAMKFNRAHNVFSKEQLANIRELNGVMPVVQGKIMNFTEADGTHPNPDFSLDKARELGFKNNCQTCTVAYELRRRGFDVEAMGNPVAKGYKKMSEVSRFYAREGFGWEERFLNADGSKADYSWSSGASLTDTADAKRAFISGKTSEAGRYEVYCGWKGGGAHVFIVERTKDGDLIWFDPQSGKKGADIAAYVESMNHKKIGLLRIDDKIINPKFADRLLKAR